MAREPRTTRQPAAPGRNVRRGRTPRSSSTAPTAGSAPSASERPHGATASLAERGRAAARRIPRATALRVNPGRTRKLLVLMGVLLVLAVTYANSLRVMFVQKRDIAAVQQQIGQKQAQAADLTAQLQRWNDPAYVKSQARSQLGWVMQGETGYRVIGLDGKVLTEDGSSSGVAASGAPSDQTRWWDRLAGSIQTADSLAAPAQR